ncbi:hypothetical protein D9M71_678990 [compost metagenome]
MPMISPATTMAIGADTCRRAASAAPPMTRARVSMTATWYWSMPRIITKIP